MFYFKFNPADTRIPFPACSFKAFTGLDCPGCGGQRALHSLLHGDVLRALSFNAFYIILLPFLLPMIYYALRSFVTGIPVQNNFLFSTKFVIALLIFMFLFFVFRNIPQFPFTLLHSDF
ncbi:MAG: DUF2752 domain-containing protein [Weeksellaceae bacterium]|nr:DUF2752 domain-containing protein [Weeksellaceae bacterium]